MSRSLSSTHKAVVIPPSEPPRQTTPLDFAAGVSERSRGLDLQREGRYREALVCFETATTSFVSAADPVQEAWTLQNQGLALELLGRNDEALERFARAEDLFRRHREGAGYTLMLRRRADLHRRRGDHQRALPLYDAAEADYRARHDPNGWINTRISRSASLLATGRISEALADLRAAADELRSYHRRAGEYDFLLFARLARVEQRLAAETAAIPAADTAPAKTYAAEAHRIAAAINLGNDLSTPDLIDEWRRLNGLIPNG